MDVDRAASYAAQVEAVNELSRRALGCPQVGPIDKTDTRLAPPAIDPHRKLGNDDTAQPVHDGLQNQLLPGFLRMGSIQATSSCIVPGGSRIGASRASFSPLVWRSDWSADG